MKLYLITDEYEHGEYIVCESIEEAIEIFKKEFKTIAISEIELLSETVWVKK